MTGLRQALAGYLDLRRGMGFKLDRDAKLLAQFISYLEQAGSVTVSAADALAWATLPAGASPGWLSFRMSVARGFAVYLRTLDPAAEIIPPGLLPGGSHRAVPYLYSAADISALLAQAEKLRTPLRTATIQALIGLLAVTGMRIGEALALDDGDFDAGQGMLIVRHAKFGKRRLLPLHQTTVTALQSYQGLRGQVFPRPCSDALLVSSTGDRLRYVNVSQTFVKLARRAGLAARSGGCRPRPHDLRHSFAVATLLDWYRGKQHPAPFAEPKPKKRTPPALLRRGRFPVSAVVCVDLDYPDLARPVARAGSVLAVPANDWQQIAETHHRSAVWAAVTAGVAVVRSAGHGIPAVYDPAGRVVARADSLDGPVVLVADVPVPIRAAAPGREQTLRASDAREAPRQVSALSAGTAAAHEIR